MTTSRHRLVRLWRRHRLRIAALLLAGAAWPLAAQAPPPDLCGCRNHPGSLGAFDTRNQATWPPGTTLNVRTLTIPLPADGVLVFDSIHLEWSSASPVPCCSVDVVFGRNAANTPVTLLVKGDVTIRNNARINVSGEPGLRGSDDTFGRGGLGGPGGFRGGDGAYRMVNLAGNGGAGLGPGGGSPGTGSPLSAGGGGTFVASADLLPLVGGSGGGGGGSSSASLGCSGGGGGGGGGAILIAANGRIVLDGEILADGGAGAPVWDFGCSSWGGSGSGGAIRLVASSIAGSGFLGARGLVIGGPPAGSPGSIRLEAFDNTFPMASRASPVAVGSLTPGPIVNPLMPSVAVTAVGGQPVPQPPQGVFGAVDVQIPAPGPTRIDLQTAGVPAGTTVEVKVKPRVGGAPATSTATLSACDGTGGCTASVTFDLPAGAYVVEARATFQTP